MALKREYYNAKFSSEGSGAISEINHWTRILKLCLLKDIQLQSLVQFLIYAFEKGCSSPWISTALCK